MFTFKVPKEIEIYQDMLNQIFEIEKKLEKIQESNSIQRNLNRLKEMFENQIFQNDAGLSYYNPIGEKYDETRTDCEASIAGTDTDDLIITEVIKPIIRIKQGGLNQIIQKAVVIAQSKNRQS